MEIDKYKLYEAIADDFISVVREYRKAQHDNILNDKKDSFCTDERDIAYEEYEKRISTLTNSKDYVKLQRDEYWQQIITAKIQVISKLGFKTMQEFCTYLYNRPENDELDMYSAFDYLADGIGGWWR